MGQTVHQVGLGIGDVSHSLSGTKVNWTASNGGAGKLQVMANHAPGISKDTEEWIDVSPAETVADGETLTWYGAEQPVRIEMTAGGDIYGVKQGHGYGS